MSEAIRSPSTATSTATATSIDYKRELSTMRQHVQALQDSVVAHTQQQAQHKKLLADATHEIERKDKELDDLRRAKSRVEQELLEERNSRAAFTQQLMALEETNRALQQQVDCASRHTKDFDLQLQERKKELIQRTEEFARAEFQLAEMKHTMEERRAAFEDLKASCVAKDDVIAKKDVEIEMLQASKGEQGEVVNSWKVKFDHCRTELAETAAMMNSYREKLTVATRELQEKQIENNSLSRQLRSTDSELEGLRDRHHTQSEHTGRRDQLLREAEVECREWKDRAERLQLTLKEAQSALRQKDSEVQEASGKMETTRAGAVTMQAETSHLRTQLQLMEERVRVTTSKTESIEADYRRELQTKAGEIVSLRGTIVRLQGQNDLLLESQEELKSANGELLERCNALQEKVYSMRSELTNGQQENVRLTTSRGETEATIASLEAQLNAQEEVITSLRLTVQRQADELRTKSKETSNHANAAQAAEMDATRARTHVHELQAKLDRVQAQLEERNNDIHATNARLQERAAKEEALLAEKNKVFGELQEVRVEVATLKERTSVAREEATKLKELPELRATVEHLTSELETTKQRLKDRTEELRDLMEMQSRAARSIDEVESTKLRNDALEKEHSRMGQDHVKLFEEVNAHRVKCVQLEHRVVALESDLTSAKEKQRALEAENHVLVTHLERAREECGRLDGLVRDLRRQIERGRVQVTEAAELRSHVTALDAERRALILENQQLSTNLSRADEESARMWWNASDAKRRLGEATRCVGVQDRRLKELDVITAAQRDANDDLHTEVNELRLNVSGGSGGGSPSRRYLQDVVVMSAAGGASTGGIDRTLVSVGQSSPSPSLASPRSLSAAAATAAISGQGGGRSGRGSPSGGLTSDGLSHKPLSPPRLGGAARTFSAPVVTQKTKTTTN
eukprot:PhM_4_TR3466/c0_g1_i1/m.60147